MGSKFTGRPYARMPHEYNDTRLFSFEQYHAIGWIKGLARVKASRRLGLERDQLFLSYRDLAKRYGWTDSKARAFIAKLVKHGVLTAHTERTPQRTHEPNRYAVADAASAHPNAHRTTTTKEERKNEEERLNGEAEKPLQKKPSLDAVARPKKKEARPAAKRHTRAEQLEYMRLELLAEAERTP